MTRKNQKNTRKSRNKAELRIINAIIRGREHDSERVRSTRRTRALHYAFLSFLGILVVIVLAVMARMAFNRAFVDSEHFTIRWIEVVTNGRLERARVLATTGVREGMNLLKLDLARIEAQARQLPQVEEVRAERLLPDGLRVTLRERMPVAWISCLPAKWRARTATSGLLVDRDGRMFRCESLAPELLSLAIIDLTDGTGIEPGGTLTGDSATAALKLATNLYDSHDTTLPRLQRVAVRNGYALEVTLENGENAWLSPDEPVADFQRLVDILDHFRRRDQAVCFANLLPRKNIAVRLAGNDTRRATATRSGTPAAPARPVPATSGTTPQVRPSPEVRAILNRR